MDFSNMEVTIDHIADAGAKIKAYLGCSLKRKYPIQQYISWQNPMRESDLADARRPPVQETA